ncbi:Uncharacterised protein [Mycobacterium tuberculosis]|nr:Uncharacterised protein [Mycobacterium tuberculosis]
MSCPANDGAYAGGGAYHAGIDGGGLHSLVAQLKDMLGSQLAELMPGVATIIDMNAPAVTTARRRANLFMAGLPVGPSRSWLA